MSEAFTFGARDIGVVELAFEPALDESERPLPDFTRTFNGRSPCFAVIASRFRLNSGHYPIATREFHADTAAHWRPHLCLDPLRVHRERRRHCDPVQSVGNSGVHALANPTPFLCDSVQADDCFMMYVSQHPRENTNMHLPPRTTAAGATPFEAVACSFELPYHDHRCRAIGGGVR